MPLFKYSAINPAGKKISGVIDADCLEGAKQRLQNQRIIVTKLLFAKAKVEPVLNTQTLINFTRELSQLLGSGLPLYESLLTIEEKYRNHKAHVLFLDLCDLVKQGKALSEALAKYPKNFDPIYVSMIAGGEKTGSLENSFFQLYKVISRNAKFKKQMKSALAYPAFLGCFCLTVLLGLFLFLIPSMKELLEDRSLHPITQTVLSISGWLTANATWFFFFLGGSIVALIYACKNKKVKNFFKIAFLKIPMLRGIFTEAILMRFCRALSVLLSSGIPIVEALRLSKGVVMHPSFEKVVEESEEGLIQGKKLSQMFAASPLFPPLVTRMLATAEETGSTAEMLLNIAEIHEEMLEKTLTQFTSLLQPVMLLILGVLVGLVLLSVLLPLTDVSSLM